MIMVPLRAKPNGAEGKGQASDGSERNSGSLDLSGMH